MSKLSDQINDLIDSAYAGEVALTKFLDFEEQKDFIQHRIKQLDFILYGGYEDSERKRGIICYNNAINNINNDNFKIVIIQSHYDKKYGTITHRHVLGTIMSLGIERNTFGDIIVSDDAITVFVTDEMANFIINNLNYILNQPMNWEIIDHYELPPEKIKTSIINVSSLRLDAIVAKSVSDSRSDSADLIKMGLVLINHVECTNVSKNVNMGDIISIRHFGRIKLIEVVNTSKKNRLNVLVEIRH